MSKKLEFAFAMQSIMKTLNRHDIRDDDEGDLTFAAFELGEHFERLRIIELLELHKTTASTMVTLPYALEQAILLIKGENK